MTEMSSWVATIAARGEDERHRQVAERRAKRIHDVLPHDRLDHREQQHRQGEHSPRRRASSGTGPRTSSACTSGLAVASMRPPTLPVTQTAALVTQDGDAAHDEVARRLRGAAREIARPRCRRSRRPEGRKGSGSTPRTRASGGAGPPRRARSATAASVAAASAKTSGYGAACANSWKRGIVGEQVAGVPSASARSEAAVSARARSRTTLTFQAPCSQTSDTVSVRHDCCGCTVAPLPTIADAPDRDRRRRRREAVDPVADRDASAGSRPAPGRSQPRAARASLRRALRRRRARGSSSRALDGGESRRRVGRSRAGSSSAAPSKQLDRRPRLRRLRQPRCRARSVALVRAGVGAARRRR